MFSFFVMLTGCTKNNPLAPQTDSKQGKMTFAIDISGTPADNIAMGRVTISKGSLTQAQEVAIANHSGTVTFSDVQAGKWMISIQLFDQDGTEIYSGSGEGIVAKNLTTVVSVQVSQNSGSLQITVEVPGGLTPTPTALPAHTHRIAYTRETGSYYSDPMPTEIWAVDTDGANAQLLIASPSRSLNVLDYHAGRGEFLVQLVDVMSRQIWKMNAEGSLLKGLYYRSDVYLNNARWARDGSRLVVAQGLTLINPDLELNQGIMGQLGVNADVPCWTPDNRIAYSYLNDGIHLIDATTGNGLLIADSPSIRVLDCANDGKLLICRMLADYSGQIGTANLDGTEQTLFPDCTGIYLARFSPDGNEIAYVQSTSGGQADICIMKRDGSGRTRIPTNTFNTPISGLCFIR